MQSVNATQAGFFSAASGVQLYQVVLAVALGVIIGYASSYLAVFLEKREKLEQEELDERAEYEKECAQKIAKAQEAGEKEPDLPPWKMESYGWTWIEKYLVPALTALLFGGFVYHHGWSSSLPIELLWVALFVHISGFDLKHRLILNVITYPSVLVALALSPLTPGLGIVSALIGAAVLGAIFFIMGLAGGGRWIGLGDAKLAVLIGAIAGWTFSPSPAAADAALYVPFRAMYAVIYGILLSGVVAIILLATRVVGRKDPIPYGPFLCFGALLVLYAYPYTQ